MTRANICVVCDAGEAESLYEGIVKCARCSHVFADLRLTDEELFALYDDRYFNGGEYEDYLAEKETLRKNFALRLKALRPLLRPERHRHLFEIGSAYGFFLELVRDRFESVRGVDVSEVAVRHAVEHLGLEVARADFLRHDLGGRGIDVACMWDTVEHLRDPHLYVEKLGAHMERGALLAVTTGDIESLNARWRKERWRLIHPPTHAHYFSPGSLARLLDRYGFDVIYRRHCGFFRGASRVAHNILVLRHNRPRLFAALRNSGITDLDFYLNLYDILYVVARKR